MEVVKMSRGHPGIGLFSGLKHGLSVLEVIFYCEQNTGDLFSCRMCLWLRDISNYVKRDCGGEKVIVTHNLCQSGPF